MINNNISSTDKFLVYYGSETYSLPNGVTAIPLIELMRRLREEN
jgi:hypothetical protein